MGKYQFKEKTTFWGRPSLELTPGNDGIIRKVRIFEESSSVISADSKTRGVYFGCFLFARPRTLASLDDDEVYKFARMRGYPPAEILELRDLEIKYRGSHSRNPSERLSV